MVFWSLTVGEEFADDCGEIFWMPQSTHMQVGVDVVSQMCLLPYIGWMDEAMEMIR